MDEFALNAMRLAASGLCCSQILLALALEYQGRSNPDLVRASAGLCNGLGDCSGACGVLSGGLCVLALYAAKGSDQEEEHERSTLMVSQFTEWIREEIGAACGGGRCADILGEGDCGQPDRERCGGIMVRAFGRCLEILAENGIDPAEPPTNSQV